MQNLSKKLGWRIKKERILQNISQEGLALMTDIDRSYVGRIERGEVNITLEKLYEIASALKCSPKDLLP
ncbi:TPA: helix-turn-helix domain-containing protein [Yersinia enterocolitica]